MVPLNCTMTGLADWFWYTLNPNPSEELGTQNVTTLCRGSERSSERCAHFSSKFMAFWANALESTISMLFKMSFW